MVSEDQEEMFGELPINCKEVAGKQSAAIAAEKAGFDSEATYRRAKTVTENATPELIEAMDQGDIGKAVEEELGRVERRGRPKTENPDQGNLIESEIVENLPQFEFPESGQKTREVAAKKAGFGNKETYRQAKTVTELESRPDIGHPRTGRTHHPACRPLQHEQT